MIVIPLLPSAFLFDFPRRNLLDPLCIAVLLSPNRTSSLEICPIIYEHIHNLSTIVVCTSVGQLTIASLTIFVGHATRSHKQISESNIYDNEHDHAVPSNFTITSADSSDAVEPL